MVPITEWGEITSHFKFKKSAWSPKGNFLCLRKKQEGNKGILLRKNLKLFRPTLYKKTPEFTTQSNVHPKITHLLAVPDIIRYFGSRL
jgi:hypothetical protein